MIDKKGITKSFGYLQVLKGIDLHIDKGEVVSIVGPSGAGKTTLLQIIGTLDKPDSGSIMVDGIDVSSLSTKKLSDFRNQHLGFVFQFHQLLPEFTALENIMIPAFISGKSRKEAKDLDKPDSGSIMVDGLDVSSLSTKKLSDFRNQHLGFVFQFHQLLPEFTALENIMIPAFIAGKSRKEAKERAEELLAFMDLSDRASHKPAELSGGEKQRV